MADTQPLTFTVRGAAERFGVGTVVSLWQQERPPTYGGAPIGNNSLGPVATAVVAADGSLTFTGLEPLKDYIAYAPAAGDRYVHFFTAW